MLKLACIGLARISMEPNVTGWDQMYGRGNDKQERDFKLGPVNLKSDSLPTELYTGISDQFGLINITAHVVYTVSSIMEGIIIKVHETLHSKM